MHLRLLIRQFEMLAVLFLQWHFMLMWGTDERLALSRMHGESLKTSLSSESSIHPFSVMLNLHWISPVSYLRDLYYGGEHPGEGANASQGIITHPFTNNRQVGEANQPTTHAFRLGGNLSTMRKPLKHASLCTQAEGGNHIQPTRRCNIQ